MSNGKEVSFFMGMSFLVTFFRLLSSAYCLTTAFWRSSTMAESSSEEWDFCLCRPSSCSGICPVIRDFLSISKSFCC